MDEASRLAFFGTMPVSVRVGEEAMTLMPRQFASGSLGWHGNGKLTVHGYRVQCNLILTVVGSKPEGAGEQNATAPKTAPASPQSDSDPKTDVGPTKTRRKSSRGKPGA